MQNGYYERKHGRILRKFIDMANKITKRKKTTVSLKSTVKEQGYSTDGKKVIWLFDMIDRSGKFAFDLNRDDFLHREVMEKMIHYSNMSWAEVKGQTHDEGKSKHHLISFDKLSNDAFDRFKARHLDGYEDSIFSFALQNRLRVVGIRENEHFHVLWYDPDHEICPSKKRHT